MADNVQWTAGSGTTIATHDSGSAHYQRVLTVHGASLDDPAPATPFPVAGHATNDGDGAELPFTADDCDETVKTVKASAGRLYSLDVANLDTAARWVQLFDESGAITVGTTVPKLSFMIPPGNGSDVYGAVGKEFAIGVKFANSIKFAITTTPQGASGPTNNAVVSATYK